MTSIANSDRANSKAAIELLILLIMAAAYAEHLALGASEEGPHRKNASNSHLILVTRL
jgi:hypothetical protein